MNFRFKSILILFNTSILLFSILVFLVPAFLFGFDFLGNFLRSAWPLAALCFLILLGLDGYFWYNHRLFLLLEREDWPALALYLEKRVIQDRRYASHLVRLLASTYLVLADPPGVTRLENRVAMANPSLLETHGLIFGAARVLGKDFAGASRFFAERMAYLSRKGRAGKRGGAQWTRWYYGFSLLLDQRYHDAADCFSGLTLDSREILPVGIAAYLLSETLTRFLPGKREALLAAGAEGRSRVAAILPNLGAWDRESRAAQTEVYIAVLAKYMKDTAQWLYGKERKV